MCLIHLSELCDSLVRHSFICLKNATHSYGRQMKLIHMCDICDLFIFVTNMTHSYLLCDWFIRLVYTLTRDVWVIHTWLIYTCVRCDSSTCVSNATHSYLLCDWFICSHVTCDSCIRDSFMCVSNATHSCVTCVTQSCVSRDWFIRPHVAYDPFIRDSFVCVSNATRS